MATYNLVALFTTMLVISATPGPSDIAVMTRALSDGLSQSFLMILGIIVADIVFIILAFLSLSGIATFTGEESQLLRMASAGLLLWFGLSLLRARSEQKTTAPIKNGLTSFSAGALITFGDPKAILFYMGLLPAFVDMTDAGFGDALTVAIVATAVIILVKVSYALLAIRARALFTTDRFSKIMQRLAGFTLIAIALYLIVS